MITPTPDQLALFKSTPGAISVHELLGIMHAASLAPAGTCAEMGSNQGKSGIAAACGLPMDVSGVRELHMVDPLFDLSNIEAWKHSCQGHPANAGYGADSPEFNDVVAERVINAADGVIAPVLHGDFSTHAIPELCDKHGKFAYVFIDSDQHQYELCRAECDLLMDRMVMGGIIAFHDLGSQFTGVENVYREMVNTGLFIEVPIPWDSIKEWVAANGGEAGNESWHHVDKPAPCYFGAIKYVGYNGLNYVKIGK